MGNSSRDRHCSCRLLEKGYLDGGELRYAKSLVKEELRHLGALVLMEE
jgi:hypothetical protein